MANQPNVIHRELLAEIPVTDLPADIQSKITLVDQMISSHEAAPDPELFNKIEKTSAKLWHAIKDWTERERPEDGDETPPTPPTPPVVEEILEEEEEQPRRVLGRFVR
jgi:hypothetical protein